jgi:hypothetical protein
VATPLPRPQAYLTSATGLAGHRLWRRRSPDRDLIAEAVLSIKVGSEAADEALSTYQHPTLSETVALAAEAFEGAITDLYLLKRPLARRLPSFPTAAVHPLRPESASRPVTRVFRCR